MTAKVYTTKTCAYCRMVKQYLSYKRVPFEEIDLEEHPEERQRIFNLTGALTVPITEVNGRIVVGLNQVALNEALTT